MHKKAGIILVAMGAVLILSALLLFAYNRQQDRMAGRAAAEQLKNVENAIAEAIAAKPDDTPESTIWEPGGAQLPDASTETVAMRTVEIDGYAYIGCLEIAVLDLKLPVMADWDYDRLKIAPCRQIGSVYSDDLVIAAHNYQSFFARLKELQGGEVVRFTDMDGHVNRYQVKKTATLDPKEVDAVLNSEYDLVLYTCTKGGATRVTVFCDRLVLEETEKAVG